MDYQAKNTKRDFWGRERETSEGVTFRREEKKKSVVARPHTWRRKVKTLRGGGVRLETEENGG